MKWEEREEGGERDKEIPTWSNALLTEQLRVPAKDFLKYLIACMFLHLPIESVEIFPELVLSLSHVDLVALIQVICLSASIFTHWSTGAAAAQRILNAAFKDLKGSPDGA